MKLNDSIILRKLPNTYINTYLMSSAQVDSMLTSFSNDSFLTNIQHSFESFGQYLISVDLIPSNLYALALRTGYTIKTIDKDNAIVSMGGKKLDLNHPNGVESSETVQFVNDIYQINGVNSSIKSYFEMGQYTFNEYEPYFTNYSPYTEIAIYLPFIGIESLPTNRLIGKTIKVYYTLDLIDCTCTAYIVDDDDEIVTKFTGKMGASIPINFSDGATRALNKTKAVLKGISTVASVSTSTSQPNNQGNQEQLTGGLSVSEIGQGINNTTKVVNSAIDIIASNREQITKFQNAESNELWNLSSKPTIIITRPVINTTAYEQIIKYKGIPTYREDYLYNRVGFANIVDCELSSFKNVNENEKTQILNQLKDGCFFTKQECEIK